MKYGFGIEVISHGEMDESFRIFQEELPGLYPDPRERQIIGSVLDICKFMKRFSSYVTGFTIGLIVLVNSLWLGHLAMLDFDMGGESIVISAFTLVLGWFFWFYLTTVFHLQCRKLIIRQFAFADDEATLRVGFVNKLTEIQKRVMSKEKEPASGDR